MNKVKAYHWNGEQIQECEKTNSEIKNSIGCMKRWYSSKEECLRESLQGQKYWLANEEYKVKERQEKIDKIIKAMFDLGL